jgi:hypothetical protein
MSTFDAHRSRPSTTLVTKPRQVDSMSDEDSVPGPAHLKFMEIVRSCRYTPNQVVTNPCSLNTSGSPSNKRKAINDLKGECALVSKKRRRRKKAAKPKKQPKIQSLPVEILLQVSSSFNSNCFWQVFICVQLQDLLYLSRSCKWLRVILTARSNRPTWVDVIWAAAMPECPADMCEIAYAHLIYDRICHVRCIMLSGRISQPILDRCATRTRQAKKTSCGACVCEFVNNAWSNTSSQHFDGST